MCVHKLNLAGVVKSPAERRNPATNYQGSVAQRGDALTLLHSLPEAKATWRDRGIPDRWVEQVDRKLHPHTKPTGLIAKLTLPGELVVDPAAGSFVVMNAARQLGRDFIGCDINYQT